MSWKLIPPTLLLVLGIVLLWHAQETLAPQTVVAPRSTAPTAADSSPASDATDDQSVPRPEGTLSAEGPPLPPSILDDLNSAKTTPANDMRLLATLFHDYASVLKGMPFGMHEEIVSALQGDNPRAIAFIPPGHPAVNADGKIIDRWGAPYFFHVISSRAVEIISAGPDGQLFTQDDIRDVPPHASVEPLALAPSE